MARAAVAAPKPPGPSAPELRAELLRKHEQHRRDRGAALLDGKPFDATALATTEQELAAIDDAEAEAARRQAQAAAAARAQHVAAVRGRVASVDAARLVALAQAESAALAMVKALGDYRDGCAAIVRELNTIGPAVPASMLPRAVDARLGDLIAAALFPVRTDAYSLGDLEWHRPGRAAVKDWPGVDRAQTARELESLLSKEAK